MADIFVSYTSSDRLWADWIGLELEKLGHVPHIDAWEITPGESIYAWMEKRFGEAEHVICVLTDDYLDRVKAPFSATERDATLWHAAKNRPGFALLVAVKPCQIPALADHLRRCELHGLIEQDARKRFADFLMPAGRPAGPAPFPGPKAPVAFPGGEYARSNIPISVPLHFLGRDDELKSIKAALARGDGRVAITALHGLRGVGKTTLAAAYADKHRADYRATWWIRAQTEPTMRADLVALGVRLGWVVVDEDEDEDEAPLAAVLERLRQDGDGILLIYDNALDPDDIRSYLPRGGAAQIIVTSSAPNWRRVAAPVEIEVWQRDTGAEYLIEATGRKGENEAALSLSTLLGGLPLAHQQAAAYCDRLGISLGEYRKRFTAAPGKLLDDARDVEHDYGLTVAKTFALAIDGAAKQHPAAAPLIEHVALLAPEPIPLLLFAEAREEFVEPFASALAGDGLDEAVAALRAFALVDREEVVDEHDPAITTDCVRLHRLVREVAAARRGGEAREDARRALLRAMAAVYPVAIDDQATWPRARRYDAIALALVDPESGSLDGLDEAVATILTRLGLHRQLALAAYGEAKPLFERALAIHEVIRGPLNTETAHSAYNLAVSLSDLDDLSAARPLYERALAIHEKVSGPDDPETASCLSSLGLLLNEQENFDEARPLLERALAIDEKAYGGNNPAVAVDLSNLGLLFVSQGNLEEARPLYERALAIAERAGGLDHVSATYLFNLADLRWQQGEIADALKMFLRVLAIEEKVLGLEHPSTKDDAAFVADSLDEIDRSDEAKALREKYGIEDPAPEQSSDSSSPRPAAETPDTSPLTPP